MSSGLTFDPSPFIRAALELTVAVATFGVVDPEAFIENRPVDRGGGAMAELGLTVTDADGLCGTTTDGICAAGLMAGDSAA